MTLLTVAALVVGVLAVLGISLVIFGRRWWREDVQKYGTRYREDDRK